MEVGSQFQDDFFEQPKGRKIEKSKSYEAKVYTPFWFMESAISGEISQETLVILKHKADLHYHSKNYANAAEVYKRCLELVPPSNNTWKRELLENLARSFIKLGDPEKALEWSLKLDESSINEDQKVVSMNLLAIVCHKLGKFKEELEALHSCMHAHKSCPEFWLRLGLCYAGLFKIDLPEYALPRIVGDEQQESQHCCAFKSKHIDPEFSGKLDSSISSSSLVTPAENSNYSPDIPVENSACSNTPELVSVSSKCDFCSLGIQIVSSCLIRTKTLIDTGGPNHLGVERDEQIKEKIDNSLKYMEVDQSFIEIASKMLGTDFFSLNEACDTLEPPTNSTSKHYTNSTKD